MRGHIGSIDPALEPLLARASTIPRVPDVVRARALARARTTAAAIPAATPPEVSPGRTGRFPIAIAASLALILGAAGTAGATRPLAQETGGGPAGIIRGRDRAARARSSRVRWA